jgi:hypothetical protein
MARFRSRVVEVEAARWEPGVEWPASWDARRFVALEGGALLVQHPDGGAFTVGPGEWVVEVEAGHLAPMNDLEFREAFVIEGAAGERCCRGCTVLSWAQNPTGHVLCGRCMTWRCHYHHQQHVAACAQRKPGLPADDEHDVLPPGDLRPTPGGIPGGA